MDTVGFRFESITAIRDVNLLPGAVKYGDVPAILALCSPIKMAVAGETENSVELMKATYTASVTTTDFLPTSDDDAAIIDWLLKQV